MSQMRTAQACSSASSRAASLPTSSNKVFFFSFLSIYVNVHDTSRAAALPYIDKKRKNISTKKEKKMYLIPHEPLRCRSDRTRCCFVNMYTNIHTYIHTYIYTCIHTYIHTYIYTCMHACIHTYIHIYRVFVFSLLCISL